MKPLAFEDLVRLPAVKSYEAAFRKATGVSLRVVPPDAESPQQYFGADDNAFCRLAASTPVGCVACVDTERRAQKAMAKKLGLQEFHCYAGLTVVALPVFNGGRHAATVVSGQILRREPTQRDFALVAKMIGSGAMPPQYFTTPSDAVAPSNSRSAGSRDSTKMRCPWAITPLGIQYHDREWGVPQHDDRALFEFLVLEGAQAGLSWSTILQKRDNYRCAFDNFNGRKVARYDARKVSKLLADRGIVRNQLKIAAAIQNAKAFLAAQKEFGSFDAYIWRFVGGRPTRNAWRALNLGQRSRNRKWQMANGKWQIGVLQAHKKSCSQFVRIDPQPRTRPKPQRGKEDRRNGHSSCLHGSCG